MTTFLDVPFNLLFSWIPCVLGPMMSSFLACSTKRRINHQITFSTKLHDIIFFWSPSFMISSLVWNFVFYNKFLM